jgi:aryl-phospho-beta-D-glucosidase BglC (GH1 family)
MLQRLASRRLSAQAELPVPRGVGSDLVRWRGFHFWNIEVRLKIARAWKFVVVVAAVCWCGALEPAALAQNNADGAAVAARRALTLRHGINLSDWFQASGDPAGLTEQHFDAAITDDDLALIKAMGFDHVRIAINPAPLFRRGQADQLPVDYLAYLDAAVNKVLSHGLAVELDIHAGGDFKHSLATDDRFVRDFADFWTGFARHYSTYDPDKVFFEVLNEPELADPYRWYGIETKIAGAIRAAAPHHTIIATGAHYSDNDDLLFLDPLRDANVIYTFHFYESHIFTHQGATWGDTYWHFLHAVPYPSTPENVQDVAKQVDDPVFRLRVIRYGTDRWNAERIDSEIGQAADWARHWGVTVICNEFGVYIKVSDPAQRAAWLTDVRTALEKRRIGWAMWDYDGGFNVVTRANGVATPDPLTVKALGRTLPAAVTVPASAAPEKPVKP